MAADTTKSTGSFNVEKWLKAAGFSSYTTDFTGHGHVNYERCVNLSEEDARAVVDNEDHVWLLMNRVKELRKLSEEDAVKLLSVSTRNKCTVCVCSCFFWSTFVHCAWSLSMSQAAARLLCKGCQRTGSNKELKEGTV